MIFRQSDEIFNAPDHDHPGLSVRKLGYAQRIPRYSAVLGLLQIAQPAFWV
jgi:hypothetical protein